MTIKLIVGLANPGKKYMATRHNAGSWYINKLAKKFQSFLREEINFFGYTSCINLSGANVHLLVPNIYMNCNGKSVVAMATYYNINPIEILIAHDEIDLPPGVAKFKIGGYHNSHKGLKDVINKFNNELNFYRLRVGIGHPGNKNKVANFVLSSPTDLEKILIEQAINEAVRCTEIWFRNGLEKATKNLHSFKGR